VWARNQITTHTKGFRVMANAERTVRPTRDTYMLQIYRGQTVSGRQWGARLVHVSGGESLRFGNPEALLAHLRRVIAGVDQSQVGATGQVETATPAANAADQGTNGSGEDRG
jgi:hypothetical protein